MSGSKDLCVFGYSGHSYVVIDNALALGWKIAGYFDKKETKINPYGIPYLGKESQELILGYVDNGVGFPAVGDNQIRKKITELIGQTGMTETSIISKMSIVSPYAEIGNSGFVSSGVVVNSLVKVGKGCILNTGSIIEHECVISDYVHVAPGAVLAGNVTIGQFSFIGANSTIKEGIRIGENVVVGAGSTVIRNIPDNETWAGTPAKKI